MIDLNITNLGITDKDTYVSITVDTAPPRVLILLLNFINGDFHLCADLLAL